jgi:hypothetical protein
MGDCHAYDYKALSFNGLFDSLLSRCFAAIRSETTTLWRKFVIRASELNGKEIPKPRIVARQRNRCNVSTDNVQEYYK